MDARPVTFRHCTAPPIATGRISPPLRRSATSFALAPDRGEPGLLGTGSAGRAVVVAELCEARRSGEGAPGLQIVEATVAAADPAFLVLAARVRAEKHAAGLQRSREIGENAHDLAARHMEQRGVGEDSIEAGGWQVEVEEILMENLAVGLAAGDGDQPDRAVEACNLMPERGKGAEITTRPAAKVENRMGRPALNGVQQGRDVLAHVVVGGAEAVGGRHAAVFRERDGDSFSRRRVVVARGAVHRIVRARCPALPWPRRADGAGTVLGETGRA